MVLFVTILALFVGPIFIGAQALTESDSQPLLSTKAYSDTPSSWTYGLNGYFDRITFLTKVSSGNILASLYQCNNIPASQDSPIVKNSLLELDSQFNIIWSTSWNTTSGYIHSIVQDSNDNLYVSGTYTWLLNLVYYSNGYILKIDSTGAILWNFTYHYIRSNSFPFLLLDSNEDLLVIERSGLSPTLLKFSKTDGSILLNSTLSFAGSVNDALLTSSNELFVCGSDLNNNAAFAKLDSSGNQVWNRTISGINPDTFNAMTLSGSYLYLGATMETNAMDGYSDAMIFKYSLTGAQIWNTTYDLDGPTSETAETMTDIVVANDGNIIACGWDGHYGNIWVVEYSDSGSFEWDYVDNSSTTSFAAMVIDNSDRILQGGSLVTSGEEDALIRYFDKVILQNDANTGGDAGDDFASATEVNTGDFSGSLPTGDTVDVYKVYINQTLVDKAAILNVNLVGDAGVEFTLSLADPSFIEVENNTASGFPKSIAFVVDVSGYWYITVAKQSGDGNYQLSIVLSLPPTSPIIPTSLFGFTNWLYFALGTGTTALITISLKRKKRN